MALKVIAWIAIGLLGAFLAYQLFVGLMILLVMRSLG
jgi:hypothetical protein